MPKILIIDDEQDLVEITQMALEFNGHDVVSANDGAAGLALASTTKPDIILLDVMMPVMNGYEVCEKLKTDPQLKKIPVIMLSAKAQPGDIQTGRDAGADSYMTKPFDSKLLLDTIARLVKN